MSYKLFPNKAVKFGSPRLTIRGGRIFLNADAGDILARIGMRFTHILWDEHAFKLALKPITKKDENAFHVSIRNGRRGGTLSAHSFLKYIGWNTSEPVIVAAEWNERERLLEALLPKEHVGTKGRGRIVKRGGKGGSQERE